MGGVARGGVGGGCKAWMEGAGAKKYLWVATFFCNFVVMNIDDKDIESTASPILYLLPVPLSDVAPDAVMPQCNIDVARRVKHFIVEDVRSARRFLKRCDRSIDIDTLTFYELNEHTDPREVASMLEPMKRGCDMAVVSEAGRCRSGSVGGCRGA